MNILYGYCLKKYKIIAIRKTAKYCHKVKCKHLSLRIEKLITKKRRHNENAS